MGPFTVSQIPTDQQTFNLTDGQGNARDLSVYSAFHLIVADPDGVIIPEAALGTFSAYDSSVPGQLLFTWNPAASPFSKAGEYRYQIKLVRGTQSDFSAPNSFIVQNLVGGTTLLSWASVLDVLNIAGASVDEATVLQAQAVIENVSHREFGFGIYTSRDLRFLKKAVAYQAAWMDRNPDVLGRGGFHNIQQDSMSATLNTKADVYLAPLAARSLKNCSWMKSRSLRMRSAFIDGQGSISGGYLNEQADSILSWRGM